MSGAAAVSVAAGARAEVPPALRGAGAVGREAAQGREGTGPCESVQCMCRLTTRGAPGYPTLVIPHQPAAGRPLFISLLHYYTFYSVSF